MLKRRKRPVQSCDAPRSVRKNTIKEDTPAEETGEHTMLERRFFLMLLVAISLVFFYLLGPFHEPVFWACVVGIIFQGLHKRVLARLGGRPNIAALATLLACVTLAIVPTLLFLGALFREGAALYARLQAGKVDIGAYVDSVRQTFPAVLGILESLGMSADSIKGGVLDAAVAVTRYTAQNTVQIGQGTLRFFVSLALMLYLSFFALRDGRRLAALLGRALPLGKRREHMLFSRFAEVTRATVRGTLVVAVVQGALGTAIFWFLGIPWFLFWGVGMMFLSLIPVVGAGLIWGPVAVYLFATGAWGGGLILTLFGMGVIGLVDNILRPILVGRETKLPDYLVLLSTIGGLALFGMSGFVLGPALASLFVAAWDIFIQEFQSQPESTEKDGLS